MPLRDLITQYQAYNQQEITDKKEMLAYLDQYDNLLTRENPAAHFTVSAWVVNDDWTKTVMAYHNIYQSWSWLGGHVDGEPDLLQVALKEVQEETGLSQLKPVQNSIYSIEILPVPAHVKKGQPIKEHLHLNITYLIQADESEKLRDKEDENSAVTWMQLEEAVEKSTEAEMKVVYQKLNDKLAELKAAPH